MKMLLMLPLLGVFLLAVVQADKQDKAPSETTAG
jgi:hypothetical protein